MHSSLRRFTIALAAAAATFAVGCSKDLEEAPDYLENDVASDNDTAAASGEDTEAPSDVASGELEALGSRVKDNPRAALTNGVPGFRDMGAMAEEEETAEPPADPEPAADAGAPAAPPAPVTKTGTCTSRYGSHRSVTKLTWVVSGKNAVMKSMSVTVTNAYRRNANDVDIWVDTPTAAEYKSFNSGDILPSGVTRSVKLPTNWTKAVGTRIRIETNFDQEGFDPSASCTITLVGS